ncbi:23S rRNA pseudouridine(955/2504/2580) synthase RluC [Pelagibaculum spongiae]|uniref:Pseudouridine synthase n=1 Tax=Pelagibaculum spongiae TaxID=2080658 RepID=A0A2V1H0V2_9GAMM|nr:23S rRNA pseudouridine(955/2504/2580) synthase RluC [Pelagibaculum spongiae]PVZ68929.1 23S rRNA pseudouridine(955/2504/2580) synthase RluC [Pelagibaculum spongiae]
MSSELQSVRTQVQKVIIDEEYQGQRIDNYLINFLKGVPKTLVYRILRKGEVRVNKKRVKAPYRIQAGDEIRIPPVRMAAKDDKPSLPLQQIAFLEDKIIYEDDYFLVLNKPSGMASHGGSGIVVGVIEAFRQLRPNAKSLELVHRLDRPTSGCMVIAKRRSALRSLQEQLREKKMNKRYHCLVRSDWPADRKTVKAPLLRFLTRSGERMVKVSDEGKPSETRFRVLKHYPNANLMEAAPLTGRTHQIRVHCQHVGFPIAGDDKYGREQFNQTMEQKGLKRLFLHAAKLEFNHPADERRVSFEADYDPQLLQVLERLEK